MNITKGQLLEILNNIQDDPQLLAKVVIDTFKRLPDSYRWQLAQQLYMDYYWDGPVITITNNITHVSRKFGSYADIAYYLISLGYKATVSGVSSAARRESDSYCNHSFRCDKPLHTAKTKEPTQDTEEKEITYL